MINDFIRQEIEEVEELQELGALEQGFRIKDLESASWAFRKIAALKEQARENEDLASKEHQRIDTWLEKQNKSLENSIEYFEGLLKAYILMLRHDNPKAKVVTPYGRIALKKAKKWVYDDAEVLKYVKENDPLLIKTEIVEKIDKTELKKKYPEGINTETGEVIGGVIIFEEENITIKVNES